VISGWGKFNRRNGEFLNGLDTRARLPGKRPDSEALAQGKDFVTRLVAITLGEFGEPPNPTGVEQTWPNFRVGRHSEEKTSTASNASHNPRM
jgi:hypothetical protein